MCGEMARPEVSVRLRDWAEELGALEPSAATRLARHLIDTKAENKLIVLDFTDAGTVSSAFANQLFLTLAKASPLTEWQRVLRFVGLASTQAQVITRSLQAARKAAKEAPERADTMSTSKT